METNKDLLQLYVSDPIQKEKEVIGAYTSYLLQGVRCPGGVERRYRDFDALRQKLTERWPGVYIPNIPHKKMIGSTDNGIVNIRIELINHFCLQLSKIGCVFNSDEVEYFLKEGEDIPKILSTLPPQTTDDLLRKYSAAFTDYDENFDTAQGKKEHAQFLEICKANLAKVKNLINFVESLKSKWMKNFYSEMQALNNFKTYENESLIEYSKDKSTENLVFSNEANAQLNQSLKHLVQQQINPYEKLYNQVTADLLDIEAMIEALESLNGLQDKYDKIAKNFSNVSAQLLEMQAGKSNLKSIFSFKNKEKTIDGVKLDKEKIEKEMKETEQIIKIATYNMATVIKEFKTDFLDSYYLKIQTLMNNMFNNAKFTQDFCENLKKEERLNQVEVRP